MDLPLADTDQFLYATTVKHRLAQAWNLRTRRISVIVALHFGLILH